MPLVRRTRAILRSAEFGFFGVVVDTRVHTPRFCGEPLSAGVLVFVTCFFRGLRMSWLIVGMEASTCWSVALCCDSGMRATMGQLDRRAPSGGNARAATRKITRNGAPLQRRTDAATRP